MEAPQNIFKREVYVPLACAFILTSLSMLSCTGIDRPVASERVEIRASVDRTRASSPDEDAIWDINTYIYCDDGTPFSHEFFRLDKMGEGFARISTSLTSNVKYKIYVIANAGFDPGHMEESRLVEWRLYISHPEGSSHGIPMAGQTASHVDISDGFVEIGLDRLMAKVRLEYDPSGLDKNIFMEPVRAKICNSPKSVTPFMPSHCGTAAECFASGYSCTWARESTLYLLEQVSTAAQNGPTPYVEVDFDYLSEKYASSGMDGLKYRFHIKNAEKEGILRNNCYTIRIAPHGDGLSGDDNWRTDTSFLQKR